MTKQNTETVSELQKALGSLQEQINQLNDELVKSGVLEGQSEENSLASKAATSAQAGAHRASDAIQTLHQQIENKPYTSLLAAFGVGYLLGRMLDRK